MPRPVKPSLLQLPQQPTDIDHVVGWARDLSDSLTDFFGKNLLEAADRLLDAKHQVVQQLNAGFTITPIESFVPVISLANVSSDPVNAIKKGRDGQYVTLHNQGSFSVTILHSANVVGTASDITIAPLAAILVIWHDLLQHWVKIT